MSISGNTVVVYSINFHQIWSTAVGGLLNAAKESSEAWEQAAMHVPSHAESQPASLSGGQLHEHQLKVVLQSCIALLHLLCRLHWTVHKHLSSLHAE